MIIADLLAIRQCCFSFTIRRDSYAIPSVRPCPRSLHLHIHHLLVCCIRNLAAIPHSTPTDIISLADDRREFPSLLSCSASLYASWCHLVIVRTASFFALPLSTKKFPCEKRVGRTMSKDITPLQLLNDVQQTQLPLNPLNPSYQSSKY